MKIPTKAYSKQSCNNHINATIKKEKKRKKEEAHINIFLRFQKKKRHYLFLSIVKKALN